MILIVTANLMVLARLSGILFNRYLDGVGMDGVRQFWNTDATLLQDGLVGLHVVRQEDLVPGDVFNTSRRTPCTYSSLSTTAANPRFGLDVCIRLV